MSTHTITDVASFPGDSMTSPGVSATVTLSDGSTLFVSHVETDPAGAWGVDAAFGANGFPHWCNGTGARYLSVKCVSDDVARELDALAASLTEGITR